MTLERLARANSALPAPTRRFGMTFGVSEPAPVTLAATALARPAAFTAAPAAPLRLMAALPATLRGA